MKMLPPKPAFLRFLDSLESTYDKKYYERLFLGLRLDRQDFDKVFEEALLFEEYEDHNGQMQGHFDEEYFKSVIENQIKSYTHLMAHMNGLVAPGNPIYDSKLAELASHDSLGEISDRAAVRIEWLIELRNKTLNRKPSSFMLKEEFQENVFADLVDHLHSQDECEDLFRLLKLGHLGPRIDPIALNVSGLEISYYFKRLNENTGVWKSKLERKDLARWLSNHFAKWVSSSNTFSRIKSGTYKDHMDRGRKPRKVKIESTFL